MDAHGRRAWFDQVGCHIMKTATSAGSLQKLTANRLAHAHPLQRNRKRVGTHSSRSAQAIKNGCLGRMFSSLSRVRYFLFSDQGIPDRRIAALTPRPT